MYYAIFLLFFISAAIAKEPTRILGIGAATIDLLLQVDEEFVANHVSIKGDSNASDRMNIERIRKAKGPDIKIAPGGNAANTIRALAKMGSPKHVVL